MSTPWRLTVKLSGRTQAPDQSRGRTMSSRAHGDTTELHGPLQRLLDVAQALFLCLAMSSRTVGTSSAGTSIAVEAESAALTVMDVPAELVPTVRENVHN